MNQTNAELQLATDFIKYTNKNVFLTGKAGTGKTTFLRGIKDITPKRFVVVAPTGVAAINAGGVTIHSFFQMSFGPYIPGSEAQSKESQFKFSKDKVKIIRSLDLLVIDEISMVRADLLDGIDAVLRRYRRNNLPFGGVQLLMIGDLHQLSPVVRDEEWQILRQFYKTYYFFSSNALKQALLTPIELKHIYRQEDQTFISLLNKVRNNQLDLPTLQALNSRYIENFSPSEDEGYITLSTHNNNVDALNNKKLHALNEKQRSYKASIKGKFPEYSYPTSEVLELKVGAQVMFVKNDSSHEKRYFNGKIGKLIHLSSDEMLVRCPNDDEDITVERDTWENIKYTINPETKEITEEMIGEFVQFPLKLAWAITIHKSQGLTFERAIIDANLSFAHGQVYVALSRCKSFEGMVLSSPISTESVKTDGTVSSFVDHVGKNPPSVQQLEKAKIDFQQKLIYECFDLRPLSYRLSRLMTIYYENKHLIQFSGVDNLDLIEKKATTEIMTVALKFQRQLDNIFQQETNTEPENNTALQERVAKASGYFDTKISESLYLLASHLKYESDNKDFKKKTKEALDNLRLELAVRMAGIKSSLEGFSSTQYLKAVAIAEVGFTPAKKEKAKVKPVEYDTSDLEHPELVERIKKWRNEQASAQGLPLYRIIHLNTIIQAAIVLPTSSKELLKVKGIGPSSVEKYGDELLEIIQEYRTENNLENYEPPKAKKITKPNEKNKIAEVEDQKTKQVKIPSPEITLNLFREGKTLVQIATQRELAITTIEMHFAKVIETGKMTISELLSEKDVKLLSEKIKETDGVVLKDVYDAFGGQYDWSAIRYVRAHLVYSERTVKKAD